jgi:hypothetical protein
VQVETGAWVGVGEGVGVVVAVCDGVGDWEGVPDCEGVGVGVLLREVVEVGVTEGVGVLDEEGVLVGVGVWVVVWVGEGLRDAETVVLGVGVCVEAEAVHVRVAPLPEDVKPESQTHVLEPAMEAEEEVGHAVQEMGRSPPGLYVLTAHAEQEAVPPYPAAHADASMMALSKRVVPAVAVAPEKVATQQTLVGELSTGPAGRSAVNWDDAAFVPVG